MCQLNAEHVTTPKYVSASLSVHSFFFPVCWALGIKSASFCSRAIIDLDPPTPHPPPVTTTCTHPSAPILRREGALPLYFPRLLRSRVVRQSEVMFVIADAPLPLSPLSAVCVQLVFHPPTGSSGTGCVSNLACADAHRAAFLWQCDRFLIPHLHFLAIFSFFFSASSELRPVSLLCSQWTALLCYFFVITVLRIPVVYRAERKRREQAWYR